MVLESFPTELWHKGETWTYSEGKSPYDCDNDALLIGVEQLGILPATPVSAVVFINWMEKLHRRQPILCRNCLV